MSIHRKSCGCNCNKKESYDSKFSTKMRSVNRMKNPLTMIQSYARSLASRGLTNKKADIPTKQLRVLSCFGDSSIGGSLSPCEHLGKSDKEPGKFYCTECGCGDKKSTWLEPESGEYSKLDYPQLSCPLKMPGFSNYDGSDSKDIIRKNIIEHYNPMKITEITVTVADKN
tara:strand:+ start:256 stop:765 length:510 start_codon:yes stop_codon:yes gene_type:complete